MDSSFWLGIVYWPYLGGVRLYIYLFFKLYFCLKIYFTLTNSVDPDEMQQYATIHLGLHCLQSTRLGITPIQRVKSGIYKHNPTVRIRIQILVTVQFYVGM